MSARLSVERLRELLAYDPGTGLFTWLVSRGPAKAGALAGSLSPIGYFQIRIDQTLYYVHRLAWLYMTGEWPKDQIDHADGNKTNNRFANLREATQSENSANTGLRPHNTSGFKGAYWIAERQKWLASIKIEGRTKFLGYFLTAEEAHAAYKTAAERRFGAFAQPARRA